MSLLDEGQDIEGSLKMTMGLDRTQAPTSRHSLVERVPRPRRVEK